MPVVYDIVSKMPVIYDIVSKMPVIYDIVSKMPVIYDIVSIVLHLFVSFKIQGLCANPCKEKRKPFL